MTAVWFDSLRAVRPRPLADDWDLLADILSRHAVRVVPSDRSRAQAP